MIEKILSLGFPTSLQMLFEVGIFTSAIWLSGLLGEITQSANQIVLNISSMTFMIASGLGVSAAIRSGNQKGLETTKNSKGYHYLFCYLESFCTNFYIINNYF